MVVSYTRKALISYRYHGRLQQVRRLGRPAEVDPGGHDRRHRRHVDRLPVQRHALRRNGRPTSAQRQVFFYL